MDDILSGFMRFDEAEERVIELTNMIIKSPTKTHKEKQKVTLKSHRTISNGIIYK